jgi:hypothetical protein
MQLVQCLSKKIRNKMTTTIQKPIDPQQLKQLHTLLQKQNITHYKAEMVGGATGGRTESSKELTHSEAADLIAQLQAMQGKQEWVVKQGDNQRKKIIAIAYNMGWEIPNPKGGKPKADMKRINDWCVKFGFGKKKLNEYTTNELPILVSVFEKVYKEFLNGI